MDRLVLIYRRFYRVAIRLSPALKRHEAGGSRERGLCAGPVAATCRGIHDQARGTEETGVGCSGDPGSAPGFEGENAASKRDNRRTWPFGRDAPGAMVPAIFSPTARPKKHNRCPRRPGGRLRSGCCRRRLPRRWAGKNCIPTPRTACRRIPGRIPFLCA